MTMRFAGLSTLLVAVALAAPTPLQAGSDSAPEPAEALAHAIAAARDDAAAGFKLRVESTGEATGFRSLEVFLSGVAIFNGRIQVKLSAEVRGALLGTLLEQGFPRFEAKYGGRPRPQREGAALRVIRRVTFEIGELSKSSVQLDTGERSAELRKLAEDLLDLVAPLVKKGVTADDLADGLGKLASGALAPETMSLRFVELPPGNEPGSILRMAGGTLTRQDYSPGRVVGDPEALPLGQERFTTMVTAIRTAQLEKLPVNLWSLSHFELEVQVLEHRKTVVARSFSRLSPDENSKEQQRFEQLVKKLRALESSPTP